jgi:hypothetical protein
MRLNRKTGENAIKRDMERLFPSLTDKKNYIYWNRKDGGAGWRRPGSKIAHVVRADRVDSTGGKMASHHARNRNKDTGRVYYSDKMFLTARGVLKSYIKSLLPKVGELASGWLPAFRKFAAMDRIVEGRAIASKLPPSFVTRHRGNGRAVDAMTTTGLGYIEGQQVWRYGRADKIERLVNAVTWTRTRDMQGQLEKRLAKHVYDANTGQVIYGG